jgi:hypothetical protein
MNKGPVTVFNIMLVRSDLRLLRAVQDVGGEEREKERCQVTCPDWDFQFCGVFCFHECATLNVFHMFHNNDKFQVRLSCS